MCMKISFLPLNLIPNDIYYYVNMKQEFFETSRTVITEVVGYYMFANQLNLGAKISEAENNNRFFSSNANSRLPTEKSYKYKCIIISINTHKC